MDVNKDGSLSLQEFKYHFKKELKKSMAMGEAQEESDQEEAEGGHLNSKVSNKNNGTSSIEFLCWKEPRHEFFSSMKKQKRIFRLFNENIV